MARLLFLAHPDDLAKLEDDPSSQFPCMRGQGIHIDARAQLFSLAMGVFLDEAGLLEEPMEDWCTDSITLNRLLPQLTKRLSTFDEQQIAEVLTQWASCQDVEDLQSADLEEYLYSLVNLCLQAQEAEAEIYVLTEH